MSALRLRRRTQTELVDSYASCDTGCRSTHGDRASGVVEALVVGRHAAFLCTRCARSWQEGWGAAGGTAPDAIEHHVHYGEAA